jgi:pyruvate dehydrogenase E2 component (dihydrolipoamide acetyltransferase)
MAITKVVMPKLSEAMETGKVLKWLKQEGDWVEGGDIIAEIETDKADIELESFGAGVLRKIVVPEGEPAPVGGLIAVIADLNEDIAGLLAGAPAPTGSAPSPVPLPRGGEEQSEGGTPHSALRTPHSSAGRIKASPLARKIAARSGVDLAVLEGSGPGGRIIRRDVEAMAQLSSERGRVGAEGGAAPEAGVASARGPAAEAGVPTGRGPAAEVGEAPIEFEDRPLSSIRAAIAKRMAQAKGPVPHFYLTAEIKMDRAWEFREELNSIEGYPKVSITDMIVKACALALIKHPGVNASFQGDTIRVHHRIHTGLAVALDEGLITPVLRDCGKKSLAQIAVESRDLVERARNRKLRVLELSGATFSISNLGMFEVNEFSAIVNPPEGAILAVGSVVKQPVIEGERVGIGRRMRLTLSCDHRVMDGAMGARFLQDLKRLLEEPLRLLV